jgi:biotin carboxylase
VDRLFLGTPKDERALVLDLANAIEAFQPDFVVPGLEPAVNALQEVWRLAESGQFPFLSADARAAIRRSIFDPNRKQFFHSKIDLIEHLRSIGVRTPVQKELHTLGDADAFVRAHGYPVIVKPDRGFAGTGIGFCRTEEELLEKLSQVLKKSAQRWCIQTLIEGPTAMVQFFAKDGVVLASYALARLETDPFPTGPTTVLKVIENAEMLRAAEEVAKLMNYNGFGSAQFVIPEGESGPAFMFEANMRIGVSMHLGEYIGIDLVRALKQSLTGAPLYQDPLRVGASVALYPQEPMRDPTSPHMNGIVDIPTDDPELFTYFKGLIQRRRAQSAKSA